MSFFDAIVLGVIEGITEFLPISSTAHLMVTGRLLGLAQTDFLKTFDIAIQLGAILAVVILYWRMVFRQGLAVVKRVFVAFIPTAIIGFFLYRFIKGVLLDSYQTALWALIIGGLALLLFEKVHKEKEDAHENLATLSYKKAFTIGIFQSLAVVPGVSRAAATIAGGLLLGMRRVAIVEFSFLLAVPTMLAATGFDLLQSFPAFTSSELVLLSIGFFTSFIVAICAITWLLRFIKTHNFTAFGWYRIVIGVLLLAFWGNSL